MKLCFAIALKPAALLFICAIASGAAGIVLGYWLRVPDEDLRAALRRNVKASEPARRDGVEAPIALEKGAEGDGVTGRFRVSGASNMGGSNRAGRV